MAKKSETPTATKKKSTSSTASSGKKSASNSKSTKSSGSSSKKSTKQTQPEKRPIRREVGGVVCIILAMLCFIGYFNVDAWFFKLTGVVKGLIGYGYYLVPPCLDGQAWCC